MRLKVISEGLGKKTRLVDTLTGEPVEIDGIRSVEWKQGNGSGELILTLIDFEVEAKGVFHTVHGATKGTDAPRELFVSDPESDFDKRAAENLARIEAGARRTNGQILPAEE